MKKIWVYLLGVLTGVILMFAVAFIMTRASDSAYTFFDEPGEVMDTRSYTVLQGGDGEALAYEHFLSDIVVLLWNREGKSYYDGQVISLKSGECFRQIGIYKYTSQDGTDRIVPIVTVMEGGGEQAESTERVGRNKTSEREDRNYVFFDNPGQVMSDKSYKVTRVLNDSCVIAKGKGSDYDNNYILGLEVLILDHNASTYYNDQIIKATGNKHFRQIGTYKTDGFLEKVIPIVKLM